MSPWLILVRNPVFQAVSTGLLFALALWAVIGWGLQAGKTAAANKVAGQWKASSERFEKDLGTCNASVETLKGSLATQDAAVAAMKAERDRAEHKGRVALAEAQRTTTRLRGTLSALIAAQPVATDELGQCRELEAKFRGVR